MVWRLHIDCDDKPLSFGHYLLFLDRQFIILAWVDQVHVPK
jgi:hypothetical protein